MRGSCLGHADASLFSRANMLFVRVEHAEGVISAPRRRIQVLPIASVVRALQQPQRHQHHQQSAVRAHRMKQQNTRTYCIGTSATLQTTE